jgi:hypothetical protein
MHGRRLQEKAVTHRHRARTVFRNAEEIRLTFDDDPTVWVRVKAEDILEIVRSVDRKISKRLQVRVVTELTWENVPDGFVAPTA